MKSYKTRHQLFLPEEMSKIVHFAGNELWFDEQEAQAYVNWNWDDPWWQQNQAYNAWDS